jgi:hypothetical protein
MSLQTLDKVLNKTADRSVGDLVATYGSNMQRLKMDAAAGKVDPTKALMAMMMIQRIVAANVQPPSGTTVAQDAGMAPPPQPMGMSAMAPQAAPQQPPVRMAYGGQVAVSNNQVPSPAMERGLDGIPIPDNMFDYADGGMVAFAGGGDVQRFAPGGQMELFPELDRFGQPKPRLSGAPRPTGTTFAQAFPSAAATPAAATPSMFSRGLSFLGRMVPGAQALFGMDDLNVNEAETLAVLKRLYALGYTQEQINAMKPEEAKRVAIANKPPQETFPQAAAQQAEAEAQAAANKPPPPKVPAAAAPAAPAAVPAKPADLGPVPMLSAARSAAEGTLQAEGGKDIPVVPGLSQIRSERVKQLTDEGYDFNLLKDMVAENRKDIEAVPQKRKEAANMRVLEAGLAILGGASPHAFVNIGKGAEGAVKGYAQDIKELDKLERDYKLQERQIRTLQNKEAAEFTKADQARLDKAIERRDNALDKYNLRVDRLAGIMYEGEMGLYTQKAQDAAAMERTKEQGRTQLAAARIGASRPSQLSELRDLFRSSDPKDRQLAESFIGQNKMGKLTYEEAMKLVSADPRNLRATPAELSRLAKEYMRLSEGGAEATPSKTPANRAPLSTFGS